MSIENPIEPGMDVGKGSFRIGLCRRSFEISYKLLLSNIINPVNPPMSILATVLPPEAWMKKRIQHYGKNEEVMKDWAWEGGVEEVGWTPPRKDEEVAAKKKKKKRQVDSEEEEEGELNEVSLDDDGWCG
jgi:hypothetical protein